MVSDGLAVNSRRTYSKAVDKFINFCTFYHFNPLAVDERLILRFISFLAAAELAPSTIRVHLSGIRAWLLSQGAPDLSLYTPRIKWALKAIDRRALAPQRAKPITYPILLRMFKVIPNTLYHMVCFTAMLIGYFGCLRAGEYLPDAHIAPPLDPSQWELVEASPPYGVLSIPSSKTAPKGFKVILGCNATQVCPVCWLRHLLAVRPFHPASPLFLISSGTVLSRQQFAGFLQETLMAASIDPEGYTPHSLRAGAATQAAGLGFSEASIQALGRWKSTAYKAYIRPHDIQLAELSARLATAQGPLTPLHPPPRESLT